eukprot:jgi/Ulvmu1/2380/UM130_0013.1
MSASSNDRGWFAPESASPSTPLMLYNSALDAKVPFVPRDGPDSKDVYWYCCGPTVYDVAHIGHARNYVTFDIIRRVLEDYFGYNVTYVMNVTDVDDKIILRARRKHLMENFLREDHSNEVILNLCCEVCAKAIARQAGKVRNAEENVAAAEKQGDTRKVKEFKDQLEGEKLKLSRIETDADRAQLLKNGQGGADAPENSVSIAAAFQDVISEHLDSLHGSSVTDKDIYRAHAARYEKEFFDDLDALGVRPPHSAPRITDHMPQIIAFIERIEERGFAYAAGADESCRSVYFDVAAFRKAGHRYGKLEPWKVGSAALAAEGESNFGTREKRSDQDFALWKASKAGEPAWDSRWGPGRPGWHIECSAMIDAVLGRKLDLHSGGSDLKFPHHDNEIAQSEAFNCSACPPSSFDEQWCNYWLHSGHLSIDGLKMSKSLKNFITIQQALEEFTARQLRLLFCLSPWGAPLTFNQQSRSEMVQKESTIKNFFLAVQVVLRQNPLESSSTEALKEHLALAQAIRDCQSAVHAALLDNIDTSAAMDRILGLISTVNVYINQKCPEAGVSPDSLRVRQAAAYVTRILAAFGLTDGATDRLGFATAPAGGGGGAAAAAPGGSAADVAAVFAAFRRDLAALPSVAAVSPEAGATLAAVSAVPPDEEIRSMSADAALDALAAVRDAVRSVARDAGDARVAVMQLCDDLRDVALVDIGIKLEDKPEGSVWMRVDPAELRQEIAERRRAAAMAQVDKAERKVQLARDELAKAEAVLQHSTTAESLADRFRFDGAGAVTHELKDGTWEEVNDKRQKAIKKTVDKEEKVRAPVVRKAEANPGYLEELRAQVQALQDEADTLNAALPGK